MEQKKQAFKLIQLQKNYWTVKNFKVLKSLPGQHPLDIGVQRGEEGRWLYPRLIEDNRPPLEYVLDCKKGQQNLVHKLNS